MRRVLRLQIAFWAGFLGWNGAAFAQQANNPSDQFSTLGRRATTINQDVRQGPSNGTNVPQNNNAPTGNNGAGNAAGAGVEGPTPATFSSSGDSINPDRRADIDFARKLARHGLLKAEMGKLAVQKGQSEEVRNIGQSLIDDHARWERTLLKIAEGNNFKLSEKLSSREKAALNRLASFSGPEFDRAFLKEVGRYQQADLALLQNEKANGAIQPLRNWASKAVPGLERRIEAAEGEYANLTVAQKQP